MKQQKTIPGPGQYDFHTRAMKTAPSFGIGTEKRPDIGSKEKVPDGGYYDPSLKQVKPQAPGYKLGTGARPEGFDKRNALANPGPGNYDSKSPAF